MGSRVGHDSQEWSPGGLGHLGQELEGLVGDQIRQIVLGIVEAMAPLDPIIVQSVVIESTVLHQPIPLVPAWRHSVAIILVEIFAKVGCGVATLLEVSGKRSLLVVFNPVGGAAVVIVGEHMVIVNIEPCQQRGAGGAAHGGGDISIAVDRPLLPHQLVQPRHELEAAQLRVLVIRDHKDDVGSVLGEVWLPVGLVHDVRTDLLAMDGDDDVTEYDGEYDEECHDDTKM